MGYSLAGGVGCQGGVYFTLARRVVESQCFLHLGDGQGILGGELCRGQPPSLRCDDERLDAHTRPTHDRHRLTARSASIGDMLLQKAPLVHDT